MHVPNQEHTCFITDHNLYYYKVMPFGLKNAGVAYQCHMMFKEQIGKTMEVYVDDMLIKSKVSSNHIVHLTDMFRILRAYCIKLNPPSAHLVWPLKNFQGLWSTIEL